MNVLVSWQQALVNSWDQIWSISLKAFSTILGAIIIFCAGLVIAFNIKKLLVEVSKRSGLDKLFKKSGINDFLLKLEIKSGLSDLISEIFQWLIVIVFFLAVIDILGLDVVLRSSMGILTYVPNVISAVLSLAVGYFMARFIEKTIQAVLISLDHKLAKFLGKLSRIVIIVVSIILAVGQLPISRELVAIFYQGLTYTIVLVVGLSLGLGIRDLISRILNDWYDGFKKQ